MNAKQNHQVVRELALSGLNDKLQQQLKFIIVPRQWAEFPIEYYCECSISDCRSRISLTLDARMQIKKIAALFIVLPEHETESIETVLSEHDGYQVVEKSSLAIQQAMA